MKILLFGEYSGFFNCLKDGLVALGHDVFLASNGDYTKNYPSDFRWDSHRSNNWGKFAPFYNVANIMLHKKLFMGYDVVLLIGPNNISQYTWLNRIPYDFLRKHNKKVYLSGAGISAHLFDYWYNSHEKYKSYMEGYLVQNPNCRFKSNKRLLEWEDELMNHIDGYIPIWYEYYEPFKDYASCRNIVRIPINPNQFEYKPNIVEDKVVFYHGSRSECKGTRFIKAAFEKMQKHFGDKGEFVCAGMLPFNEYMKLVERTNVIVDDANSYSVAMNGFFSMLKGKLIMGGAEPVANKMYGYENNPIFNICPDVDQICDTMIDILNRKDEIEMIGKQGRKFVEKYHDYKQIAQQYIDIFNKDLNG